MEKAMTTRAMRVANIAFLLDRLAADTPPTQQIRELTQNAIEAIQRRQKSGDSSEGIVRWDVDWDHLKRTSAYKLSIVDNGDGMTPAQMLEYLNALAVQGASQTQGISENFGVGAKITALHRNSHGLVYQSWHGGKGAMVKLHRDDKEGVYGLDSFELADGPDWTPRIKDVYKPSAIDRNGTKVTLLGTSKEDNTCFPPESDGAMNWLITYLTGRYFRIPENIKLQARVLTKDDEKWPTEEPPASEKTFNNQTIRGTKALFDEYAKEKGTVALATADAHWWVFDDPREASKKMSTRGGRTCKVGVVFQDEVYVQLVPPTARRILAGFGIVFGADYVVIYLEPRKTLDIRADTARSRIIINGEDLQKANWFETWGSEFREKMPAAIKAKIDEIMAKTEGDPNGKTRERIRERLQRIRELLKPSRYRKDPNGQLRAAGRAPGGVPSTSGSRGDGDYTGGGRRGGRSSNDYLADLVESGGEPATQVAVSTKEPEVKWISRAAGTREEGELDDLGASVIGDTLTSDLVKANRDFRGYRDLIDFFGKEFNPGGDEAINRKIVEYVEEWLEGQLVEAIMTVRNLVNGRTWTPEDIDRALSPYALTTAMMTRFHIVEKVRRSLNSDLAKPSKAA
jgi:hypothetical protein